jgi:hypothetical protein
MPGHVLLAGLTFRLNATRDITLPPLSKTQGAGIIATKTNDHDLWRYFFTGTLVLVGNTKSETPIVLFYNPFLDGALLTRWRWITQSSLEPIDGIFILGAALRGDPQTTILPEWWNSPKALDIMVAQYSQARNAFEKNFPFAATNPPTIPFKTSFAINILTRAKAAREQLVNLPANLRETVARIKNGQGINSPELQGHNSVLLTGVFPYLHTNQYLLLINPSAPKFILSLETTKHKINVIQLE